MRQALLALIGLYRFVRPVLPRRRCLFVESCSEHVERVTRTHGFVAGTRALGRRARQCRPGYRSEFDPVTGVIRVMLRDGTTCPAEDLAPGMLSLHPRRVTTRTKARASSRAPS